MSKRYLSIRVSEETFKQIKMQTVLEGKSLKDYLLEIILKDLEKKRNAHVMGVHEHFQESNLGD